MKIFSLIITFSFLSCSSLVKDYHQKFDKGKSPHARKNSHNPIHKNLTNSQRIRKDQRPIKDPITYSNIQSTRSHSSYRPSVKREYREVENNRYKAEDFIDNESEGSLWTGKHSEGFIFTNHNVKNVGDIVIVQVEDDLNAKIDEEVERAFKRKRKLKKGKKPASIVKKDKEKPVKKEVKETDKNDPQLEDRMSTLIVQKINKDYILVRGIKEVMYKNIKRFVTVESIVPKRDIDHNDQIKSSQLLETSILVKR